jgi:hypothetical protein
MAACAKQLGHSPSSSSRHCCITSTRTAARSLLRPEEDCGGRYRRGELDDYEQGLEERIADLHGRLHRGAYRASRRRESTYPSRTVASDRSGIASLEDKIVQKAVVWVLQSIYEQDFLGFSYGFRPGKSQHQALDALSVALAEASKVNWVLDADVEGFFDAIDHQWLIKFLEHRIGDKRILRLIRKWLAPVSATTASGLRRLWERPRER